MQPARRTPVEGHARRPAGCVLTCANNPRNADTGLIRVPSKSNLCLDDGGALRPGQTKALVWTCDAGNNNQIWQLRQLPNGAFQVVAARKNNLCLDNGGGGAGSQFHLWTCEANNVNQQFALRNPGGPPPPPPGAEAKLTKRLITLKPLAARACTRPRFLCVHATRKAAPYR